jgi:hypothetical protein
MDSKHHKLLRALRTKYLTIQTLRLEAPFETASAARPKLAALAREFPGALRELDQLPMDRVEERLRAIERALDERAEPEPWMQLQAAYHGFMRAVLRIRRLSRGRSLEIIDAERELEALSYEPADDEPPACRFDRAALLVIRRPPGGRLNPWVLAEVARDCGVAPESVHKALFLR